VTDSNNELVFESGRINADGSIVDADNDFDQTVFEPHYNTITSPDQVQIYEAIMGDSGDQVTYTLLRAARYVKDNRLTPKGFDKLAVPDDVAVHGAALNDADFNLGSDEVVYRIDIPPDVSGDLDVSVSLNFQTIMHGYLQDLYMPQVDQPLPVQVVDFKAMYEAQSLKHEPIASVQTTVVSDGGGTPTPLPTVVLSVSPSIIDAGQSATLNWSFTDATSCTASASGDDNWSGTRSATSGSEIVSPGVTSTYTLTCTGDGGTASESVTITVNTAPAAVAPIVTLTASPASVSRGGTITLSWSSTDATSCTASGNWFGTRPTAGSESIAISNSVTFTLTCSGDGGSASSSVSYGARGRRWLDLR